MTWDGVERRKNIPPVLTTETIERLERYIDEVHTLTLRHDEVLFGKDGRGGVVRDVDHMIQAGMAARWVLTPMAVAVVALVVNQFGHAIFKY